MHPAGERGRSSQPSNLSHYSGIALSLPSASVSCYVSNPNINDSIHNTAFVLSLLLWCCSFAWFRFNHNQAQYAGSACHHHLSMNCRSNHVSVVSFQELGRSSQVVAVFQHARLRVANDGRFSHWLASETNGQNSWSYKQRLLIASLDQRLCRKSYRSTTGAVAVSPRRLLHHWDWRSIVGKRLLYHHGCHRSCCSIIGAVAASMELALYYQSSCSFHHLWFRGLRPRTSVSPECPLPPSLEQLLCHWIGRSIARAGAVSSELVLHH